jgi:alkylated DNA repair protein (DNA oxidative demethylase)
MFQEPDTPLSAGAAHLVGFARPEAVSVLQALDQVARESPYRRMQIPGGKQMSVEMTNCGQLGWISDRKGYRYAAEDPLTGKTWPAMPAPLQTVARRAAQRAGYANFEPDVCLVNRYSTLAQLGLHQDRDELDFSQPIVSVSLGLSATFLWGGKERGDRVQPLTQHHGDVFVFGADSRLNYHGISAILAGDPLSAGLTQRINLTFRRTGYTV